jgi:hypothetical protein
MQQAGHRRRASLLAAALFVLSAGAGAIALIEFTEFPILQIGVKPGQLFQLNAFVEGLGNTGFSIRSRDGFELNISGLSTYNPAPALQSGQRVQEGFILLDGTLSLDVDARKLDGTRARTITTYRLDVRRRALGREHLARTLLARGIVRDATRARTRARAMRLDDARVMRLVERRDGSARWIRAIRAIRETRARTSPVRTAPDGVLGHYGLARSPTGDPYVWAVMDRNSEYAVGLTVDRDRDGVPNSADNCVGSPNPNQSDADGDGAGDDCDIDDDNDAVADAADNCPLTANADQFDQDGDLFGDACDFDDDNDGVLDGADKCLATAAGSLVGGDGCSIADTCPCESSWRNHGAYVKCVAQTSNSFLSAGLITSAQKDAIVSAGAQSVCGF